MASFDNVLYIIGNGFDLHHGVMSSYGAFEAWLKRQNKKLYSKLNGVCRVDYLWRDFEKALADVDRDYFLNLVISGCLMDGLRITAMQSCSMLRTL